jgi:hypothetical protein
MCLAGGELVALAVPSLNFCVASERHDGQQGLISIDGCIVKEERDLWAYFIAVDPADSIQSPPIAEVWKRARESHE